MNEQKVEPTFQHWKDFFLTSFASFAFFVAIFYVAMKFLLLFFLLMDVQYQPLPAEGQDIINIFSNYSLIIALLLGFSLKVIETTFRWDDISPHSTARRDNLLGENPDETNPR